MAAKKRKTKKETTQKAKNAKAKTGKKKTRKAARTPAVHGIVIRCDGGCVADPDEVHVEFGDIVVFIADGTDVAVRFGSRSPFGRRTFIIREGDFDADRIDKRTGTFDYTPECEECAVPALPPRIIID